VTWVESVGQRQRRSKTWQDSADPRRFALASTLATLHYESAIDSGVYDAEVDFTPEHVTTGGDYWRITEAGWHYALGQPPGKATDGWVGFGGRQGQHWLLFRLLRVGWLRWTNRSWVDVGGAPTYNRANLSAEARALELPTGASVVTENVATWRNIWTTPGGGELWATWRGSGDGLKEELRVNQAGRNALAASYPGGAATNQYLSFVFQLDAVNIPKWLKNGVLQNVGGDFNDDGDAPIELRDAADRLLALLPIDYAWVEDANGDEIAGSRIRLRKRIYTEGGNAYLLVGAQASVLNSLPAGTLVFDPTVSQTVAASADDAEEASSGTVSITGANLLPRFADEYAGFRWDGVPVPPGSTVTTAYIRLYANHGSRLAMDWNLDFQAADDPATFAASSGDIDGRALTGNAVTWTATLTLNAYNNSPSLVTPLQAVISRAGWVYGNAIVCVGAVVSTGALAQIRAYDGNSTQAAVLYLEYSTDLSIQVAAGGDDGLWGTWSGSSTYNNTSSEHSLGVTWNNPNNDQTHLFARFLMPAGPAAGATADGVVLLLRPMYTDATLCQWRIYGVLANDPDAPANHAACEALSLTTAYVDWDKPAANWANTTDYPSPDLKTIIQELWNAGYGLAGEHVILLVKNRYTPDNTTKAIIVRSFNDDPSRGPRLLLNWTAGAGGPIEADATDGLVLGEARSALASLVAAGGDGLALGEARAALRQLLAAGADGLAIGEISARSKRLAASATDGLSLGSSQARRADFTASVPDGLLLGDASSARAALVGTAADGLTLGEALAAAALLAALAADGIRFGDEALGEMAGALEAAATDGLLLGESSSVAAQLVAQAADGLQLGETLAALARLLAQAANGLLFGDAGEGSIGAAVVEAAAADGLVFGEAASVVALLDAIVQDGLVFGEDGQVRATFVVSTSDGLVFGEALQAVMRLAAIATDGLRLGDVTALIEAVGVVTVTFTVKQGSVTFTVKQPGASFEAKQPGASITGEPS
jgi:hypothetical protein